MECHLHLMKQRGGAVVDPFDWTEWARFAPYDEEAIRNWPYAPEWAQFIAFDRQRDWREQHRENCEQLEKFGHEHEIDAWMMAIFDSLLCPCGEIWDEAKLSQHSFGDHAAEQPELATQAIQRCFDAGWIRCLNEQQILELYESLQSQSFAMPCGLFGFAGDWQSERITSQMTFTEAGAKLANRIKAIDYSQHWCSMPGETKEETLIYANSIEAIDDAIQGCSYGCDVISVTDPVPSVRWCDRWWNRFESGFMVRCRMRERLSNAN